MTLIRFHLQKESIQPELINVIGVQPVGVGGMADVYLGEWVDALKGSQKVRQDNKY